jgi:exo-poly-alpha-galacturonosidase
VNFRTAILRNLRGQFRVSKMTRMKTSLAVKIFFPLILFTATTIVAAPARYVISELGAIGDGTNINTKAIQSAIDKCAADGGGVIVVPKGTFISGALYFKQGVNLLVEKDGVLKSTTNMADFPPIYTRWEGVERYWTSAFLNFVGMTNIEVSGEGLIDGSGTAFGGGRRFGRGRGGTNSVAQTTNSIAPQIPAPTSTFVYPIPAPTTLTINLLKSATNLPVVNAAGIALPRDGGRLAPPRLMVFQNCANVRVSGLHILNQARWGVVFIYTDDVLAENLDVRNPQHNIPSSDCMDICSCSRVHVTGCYFECNDDCLSIKSGKDEDGLRVNRPSEDILIEKTHFAFGHGGAAMGSETSGGIRRVKILDCISDGGNLAPVRFKTQPSRGGVVEDITYENFTLNGTRTAFDFDMAWRMVGPVAPPAKILPVVRNVKIINLHGTVNSVGNISGLPDSPIVGLTFVNCHLTAQRGLVMENTRDVDTNGLTLEIQNGGAIVQTNAP